MPAENELVLTIQQTLRRMPQGSVGRTHEIAKALVAELRLGDGRAVEDVKSLIKQEAAAMGVRVEDE
jgi:hypothetical protein